MNILDVTQITKSYKGKDVLKGCSFKVSQPGVLALVGPNGSGKSTLLNIMTGLERADGGQVQLFGQSPDQKEVFHRVSFLKDNTVLYPYLTGRDHLSYAGNLYKVSRDRIRQVVQLIGIEGYVDQVVSQYSLGMKQHLLLALAILNAPDLIIMDEPLNGLDPTSIIKTRQLILDLATKGTTILMSSHTLSEVDAVTNHILFLRDGLIYEEVLAEDELNRRKTAEERYMELYLS